MTTHSRAIRRRHPSFSAPSPIVVWLLALLIGLSACVNESRPESCDRDEVTIEVTVTADSMTPSDPAVCRDQRVRLEIDSETDGFLHVHGYDEALPIVEVTAGDRLEVDFVADRSGQFPIELHPADDPAGISIGILTVHER